MLGDQTSVISPEIERHLAWCPECSKFAFRYQKALSLIRTPTADLSPTFDRNLNLAILREKNKQPSGWTYLWTWLNHKLLPIGAVAALILSLGTGLHFLSQLHVSHPDLPAVQMLGAVHQVVSNPAEFATGDVFIIATVPSASERHQREKFIIDRLNAHHEDPKEVTL